MRKNKSKLMAFSLLALCLACLGFGVYALKNATLTVTGTVGFTAHDCLVNVMAEIEGDGVVDGVPNSHGAPSEKRDLIINKTENSNEMIVGGATADDWNKEAEIAETIWFTDLTEDGSVSEIVMTFTLTNQSTYPIVASIENADIADVVTGASDEITIAEGASGILTATFNLALKANGEYPEINSLQFVVKLDFKKAPAIQAPKNVSIENDILTFTPVEGATGYEVAFFSEGEVEPVYVYTTTESGLTLQKPEISGEYNVKIRSVLNNNKEIIYSDYVGNLKYVFEGCTHLEFGVYNSADDNSDTVYTVTGIGRCTDETIVIPSTYLGKKVIAINSKAFSNKSFKKVIMPKEIIEIGSYAFTSCSNLTEVIYSSSIQTIEIGAFKNCSNLTEVTIPCSSIKQSVFEECSNLKKVTILGKVYSIGLYAFRNCISLEEINIPEEVETFGASAFTNCSSLKEITIPKNTRELGGGLFSGCTSLEKATILGTKNGIPASCFGGCVNLKEVLIPDGVGNIANNAFYNCSSLTNFSFPESVSYIRDSVFYGCTSLTEITIPSKVKTIGNSVFYGCTNLSKIILPEEITSIGESAFYNCKKLKEFVIPEGITVINESTFQNCEGLTKVILPSSIKEIGANAFYACKNLEDINLSNIIENIGTKAFYYCTRLTNLIIPKSIKNINANAFQFCSNIKLFYDGTADEFKTNVENLDTTISSKIYYYYENEVDVPTDGGNYWHYVTDETTGEQVPTVW